MSATTPIEMKNLPNDVFVWQDDNGRTRRMQVLGTRLLARRTELPTDYWLVGDQSKVAGTAADLRIAEEAIRTYQRHFWTFMFEVLAVSQKANCLRSPRSLQRFFIPRSRRRGLFAHRRYAVDRNIACPIVPGDLIIMGDETSANNLRWRGITGSPDDCMIDVCEIVAYVPWETLDEGSQLGATA